MSTFSLENIRIGPRNQLAGSDSLYDAFNKIQNNFSILANANLSLVLEAGLGVNLAVNGNTGSTKITNTGVINLYAGNNVTVNRSNGMVTLDSYSNVALTSNTLSIANSSAPNLANFSVNLSNSGVTPGTYTFSTVTIDQWGRITSAANGNASAVSGLANGTSSVSIPVANGNIAFTVGGNTVASIASSGIQSNQYNVGNTVIGWSSVTTGSIGEFTIVQIPVSNVATGYNFLVKGIDTVGSKYSVQSITAVTDGITANFTIHGSTQIGGNTGSFCVDVSSGNLRLLVTPTSSNSTVWTTQYQII